MSLCGEIKINGLPAYPELKIHPHYYADKYVACDWIVYQRFWYTECLASHPDRDVAMMYYNCVSNIINATSVYTWETWEPRKYQPRPENVTYIQTVKKKENVFEIHLYKTELGHYHTLCVMGCHQWGKDRGKYFSIGDGTNIEMIY